MQTCVQSKSGQESYNVRGTDSEFSFDKLRNKNVIKQHHIMYQPDNDPLVGLPDFPRLRETVLEAPTALDLRK